MTGAGITAGRPRPDEDALRAIDFLLLDVDGVLTDGRVHFDFEGREYKSFHVHDAAGIIYWHRSGGRSGSLGAVTGGLQDGLPGGRRRLRMPGLGLDLRN